jgi:hypothetical protein
LEKGGFAIVAKQDISDYNFEKLKKEFKNLSDKFN